MIYLFTEPLYTPTALSTPAEHAFFPKWTAYNSLTGNHQPNHTKAFIQAAMAASAIEGIKLDIGLSQKQVPFLYHTQHAK